MNITDPIRYRAELTPDAVAVIRADDDTVSYRDFDRLIDAVALRIDGIGLLPGQVAGLAMTGPDEFPPLVVALALARAGIASADPALPAGHMDIFIHPRGAPAREGTRDVAFDDTWFRPPRALPPIRRPRLEGSAVCRIFASSGTTGTPNFAAVSHAVMAARVYSHWLSAGPSGQVNICGIGLGISWGFRFILRTFWSGASLVLTNPSEALSAIQRHQVDCLAIAPVSLEAIVRAMPDDLPPPPSLKAIETGGAPFSPALHALVRRRLCDNVVSFFGSTETGGVASAPTTSIDNEVGAVGFVHAGVEVQVVDADDQPVPPGGEGILRMRSTSCVDRYFGPEAAPAATFKDGWVYLGDVGSITPDGIMTVNGRTTEFINAGGIKISPHVIENVLLAIPDVTDAAAFGVPDQLGVIRIWAAIVAPVTVPRSVLNDVCREQLGGRAPKFVLQVKGLPRNANGKVMREELMKFALTQQS